MNRFEYYVLCEKLYRYIKDFNLFYFLFLYVFNKEKLDYLIRRKDYHKGFCHYFKIRKDYRIMFTEELKKDLKNDENFLKTGYFYEPYEFCNNIYSLIKRYFHAKRTFKRLNKKYEFGF